MNVKKLMQVLVIGGAALTAMHCGGMDPSSSENTSLNNGDNNNLGSTSANDGGVDDGGVNNPLPPGGPPGW